MPAAVATYRLLLTGSRLSKIQMLHWDSVMDDCIELLHAKSGGQKVPLEPEARAGFATQPRIDGNPWVIAGKLPGTHVPTCSDRSSASARPPG